VARDIWRRPTMIERRMAMIERRSTVDEVFGGWNNWHYEDLGRGVA
jgi:hypothetical protein